VRSETPIWVNRRAFEAGVPDPLPSPRPPDVPPNPVDPIPDPPKPPDPDAPPGVPPDPIKQYGLTAPAFSDDAWAEAESIRIRLLADENTR